MAVSDVSATPVAAPAPAAPEASKKKAADPSPYSLALAELRKFCEKCKLPRGASHPPGVEGAGVYQCGYTGSAVLADERFHIVTADPQDVDTKRKHDEFLECLHKNRLLGTFASPVAAQKFVEKLLVDVESRCDAELKTKIVPVIESWIKFTRSYYSCHHTESGTGADDLLLSEIDAKPVEELICLRPSSHHVANIEGNVTFHVKVPRKRKADDAGVGSDDAPAKRQQVASKADAQVTAAIVDSCQ